LVAAGVVTAGEVASLEVEGAAAMLAGELVTAVGWARLRPRFEVVPVRAAMIPTRSNTSNERGRERDVSEERDSSVELKYTPGECSEADW
jgi:hypothetical protein